MEKGLGHHCPPDSEIFQIFLERKAVRSEICRDGQSEVDPSAGRELNNSARGGKEKPRGRARRAWIKTA